MAAYILLALTVRPNTAYGAPGIDTSRTDCSITFELGGDNWVIQDKDKATGVDVVIVPIRNTATIPQPIIRPGNHGGSNAL